jgi:hypothetical protein
MQTVHFVNNDGRIGRVYNDGSIVLPNGSRAQMYYDGSILDQYGNILQVTEGGHVYFVYAPYWGVL